MKKLLYIDTETSGLNPQTNGILSVAGIIEIDGVVKEEFYLLNNPENKMIEETALQINGFTVESILKNPPSWKTKNKLIYIFDKYINKYDRSDKFVVIGQNVKFDIEFLYQMWKDTNDEYFFSYIQGGAYLDTMYILTFLQSAKKVPILENRRNATISKYFGTELTEAHNALADIRATRENFLKMKQLI